jgi:hypothetical protein
MRCLQSGSKSHNRALAEELAPDDGVTENGLLAERPHPKVVVRGHLEQACDLRLATTGKIVHVGIHTAS